jgi:hypothetical protein
MKGLTKLKIKIESPPISIFECKKGEKDIDRTGYFEHAMSRQNTMYWMVPDGTYLVTQGNKPCIYIVDKGEITQKPVGKEFKGGDGSADGPVKFEDTTEPGIKPKEVMKPVKGVTLSEIMHTSSSSKDKKK